MEKLMTRQAFSKALLAARTQRHSGAHPFSLAWADGKLTRAQLGFWAVQHYYYIEQIPQQFGHLFCRLPDLDARRHMLENLIGEEVPDKQGKRHPDLLLKFAHACGVAPRRVSEAADRGDILPGTRAMRSWIYELVAFRELAEAAAGIMVALEGQTPTLYPKYVEACRVMGMNDDDLEFFHVHIENDSHHEGEGLQITYRYAHTPALQLKAVAAVAASARQRLAMLDGIWSAIETGDWKLRQKA